MQNESTGLGKGSISIWLHLVACQRLQGSVHAGFSADPGWHAADQHWAVCIGKVIHNTLTYAGVAQGVLIESWMTVSSL